jgi:phosphatidylglycerol:prolipoprotein diacylglycerol transferase
MHRVFFKIGNFDIYTYGVMLVIGFMVAIAYVIKRNNGKYIKNDDILDFSFYLLLGGVLGARLVYVLLHLGEYLASPLSIINLREGGLAWHGAILGGFTVYFIFCRKRKIDVYEFLDLCAPSIMLGLAIGRIGCFLNGCCIGMETSSPPGMIFPDTGDRIPRHPTQLYELVLDILIVLTLLWWEKRKKFSGELTLLMLSLYSVARFVVESFRLSPPRIFGLSIAQYSSIIFFIVTAIWIYIATKNSAAKEEKPAGDKEQKSE